MIGVGWAVYAVGVGSVIGAAAWIVDRILSRSSAPTRWIWAVALGLAVLLPVLGIGTATDADLGIGGVVVSSSPEGADDSMIGRSVLETLWETVGVLGRPASEVLDRVAALVPTTAGIGNTLLALWGAASLSVLLLLIGAHLRVRTRVSGWPERVVGGASVRLSSTFGPATVGIRSPQIVLPTWTMALPDDERQMIVRHEAAHVAAGDTRLLGAALLSAIAMPWNPVVWWMLRRLRDAVELDCDRRTLVQAPSAAGYARLLMGLGHRVGGGSMLAAPTLAGRRPLLERRLRALKQLRATGPGRAAVTGTVFVGLLALGVACGTDVPPGIQDASPTTTPPTAPEPMPVPGESDPRTEPSPEPDGEPGADARGSVSPDARLQVPPDGPGVGPVPGAPDRDDISAQPTFIPYEVAPEIRNRGDVLQALQREYPTQIRDAGIGGRILLHFFIDETGQLGNVQIAESSGLPQLDEAALRVARVFDFTPALNEGEPTAVWIMVPVTFESR